MEELMEEKRKYFNENLNIGYIPKSTETPTNEIIWKHYLSSIIVYGFIIILYYLNPFFIKILNTKASVFFSTFYILYVILAPIIYFTFRPKSIWKSHNIEICNYVKRIFSNSKILKTPFSTEEIKTQLDYYKPTYLEKQSIILLFIKAFFGPLMLSGVFSNLDYLTASIPKFQEICLAIIQNSQSHQQTFWETLNNNYRQFLYAKAIIILFTIDISIFSIGYLTELSFLKNKIRTVETTAAGLFFCLICYPPFVYITVNFINWNENNYVYFLNDNNSTITWTIRGFILFFVIIYVWASVALGTKGSNLTNRGIVTKFPYSIIRHPAYTCKNTFWFISGLTMLANSIIGKNLSALDTVKTIFVTLVCLFAIAFIYYYRALTEERHLIQDPDYQEYIKKVKYRFIPGVF